MVMVVLTSDIITNRCCVVKITKNSWLPSRALSSNIEMFTHLKSPLEDPYGNSLDDNLVE